MSPSSSTKVPTYPASPRPTPREGEVRAEARTAVLDLDLARRYQELDREPSFPMKEYQAFARRGWLGPRAPRGVGGGGWRLAEEAALLEEIAYGGGSVFAKLVLQPEFCSPLLHASPELIDRWYVPLLRGELLVGNQITEPKAGSDAAGLESRAEKEGETYLLTGTKSEIAFAKDARAAIVYASTSPGLGARGISAFLVPQDLRGISTETFDDLGERWMRRGTITYDRVRVPASHLIGQEGQGFSYLMEELTPERALLGLVYLAIARRSWEETRLHVGERTAFGRPLASNQGISFPLVEDYARMESARLFAWQTLERIASGEGRGSDSDAALVKWLSNQVALEALDHAMQFHGGAGYSRRLPHEQRWRDVRSGTSAHGTSEILRFVAARDLLGTSSRARS